MKRAIPVFSVLLIGASFVSAQSVRERFQAASAAGNAKNFAEAVAIYQAIADDPKVSREDRATAWARRIDVHRAQKHFDQAVVAAKQLLALQQDDTRRKLVMLQVAELHMQAQQALAAVEVLKELAAKYPEDDDNFIQANLVAGNYLVRDKKHADAVVFFESAAKRMDVEDPRRIDAIWNASTALWESDQIEKSIEITKTLVDPKLRSHPRLSNRQANDRIIGGLTKLKRQPEVVALLKEWEQTDPDVDLRARWCLSAARNAAWSGDAEGGLESYRRLMLAHASVPTSDGWFEAQNAIVDGLIRKNDFPAALKAAHVLFDAAHDQGAVTMAVSKMADLLNRIDGNNKRSKALVNYQLFGPAGRDGKVGTEDDEANLLPEIGYPDDPERTAAFAKAFAAVGDDAAGTFHRGQLCLYLGKPSAATDFYLQAIRKSTLDQWPTFVSVAVMNGWRPLNTHGHGMDAVARYFLEGDGSANPFKEAKFEPAPWPLPTPSTESTEQLRALRASLWELAEDASLPSQVRHAAVRSVGRIGQVIPAADELDRFLALTREQDGGLRDLAALHATRASRGDSLQLAPMQAFAAGDRLPANAAKRTTEEVRRMAKAVEKLAAKNAGVPKMQPVK